ncbi:hypothetical protein C2I17_00195 [Niallia circulans]|jgi:xanthine dehydrogenase accessory factor|uniref:XdhC family protein n=1 Tax=Niallia circulans TaxID=1397 RepID=UPI00201E2F8F|nr:XdhC/CoxI family protein [Niallia circulans]UQZ73101.1 hypothetical protein C2I17_00195 [Niallia circulans]
MSSDHYAVIDAVIAMEKNNYLATIVNVEGTAYRKEGTLMYITETGKEEGLLTGGCVEQDLLARIEMQKEAKAFLMEYDLRSEDDLTWGQGVGCDGKIYIMVEPITPATSAVFQQLKSYMQKGESVKLIKSFHKINKFLVNTVIPLGKEETNPALTSFLDTGNNYIFTQVLSPQPRLIIYGAGPDVRPVVYFASKAGFYVILSDWREANCSVDNFPDAKEYQIGSPTQVLDAINPSENDYVLLMTHNFSKDQEFVHLLLERRVKFLGLLGSKKRSEKLLAEKIKPDWVHYPVGISIHSESPEEIAISITAQLIKLKNSKNSVMGKIG